MKKIVKFTLLFFIGMTSVSCSETEKAPLSENIDAVVNTLLFEEAKIYLSDMDISLPDMSYTMGRVSASTGTSLRNGGLSLDWSNVQYTETGNLEILMIPIEMQKPVTVARYYKENGKAGKTILTSLYPYLSVRKNKHTGALSSHLISYAPDVRFLRNHKLDFHNFLESQPLMKDYSGLFLVSEMDGRLKDGTLYYRGKVKHNFTFNNVTGDSYGNSIVQKLEKGQNFTNRVFSIVFLTEEMQTKAPCNCKDNEIQSSLFICDGCNQHMEDCKCCGVCQRCGENPCVICSRCPECGNYDDECTCNLCEHCNKYPCSCPNCIGCGKKYAECSCSVSQDCYSKGCTCPRCRH